MLVSYVCLAVGNLLVWGITKITFREGTRAVMLFVVTGKQFTSKSFITDVASVCCNDIKVSLLTRTIVRGHQFPRMLKKLDVGIE